ncbi:MAG: 50S ribosomal protein L25 [Actinomycetota bacterium]|nr:50S ribosomal protein L25 [Actinomycetota bacterium]
MAEITLTVETGRPVGSRPSKRLRAAGKVPGVVYGHGTEPMPVAVEWKPLRQALTTDAGLNALINLVIDGKRQLSIVKELQRHPLHQSVDHVDFLLISRDEAITVDVPVLLSGEAEAVTREDGMVDHVLFDLTITAKPADIPNELTVDISAMTLGDTLRVGDLRLPAGVTTEVDPEEAIAIAQITRATIEADEIAEADAELAAEQAEDSEEGEGGAGGESTDGGDATSGDEGGSDS